MLFCAWCGREPAITNVELIIGKTTMFVPLCGKHYIAAVMYERLGLQGFLRGLVQGQLPRKVSKTFVPRIHSGAKRKH